MDEFLRRLFDPMGFTPQGQCDHWNEELLWLHIGSDLFLWLAFLSIPLVLVWFARRWKTVLPRRATLLFAAFLLATGFTHFFDLLMFYVPIYRAAGLFKLIAAVVSWVMVLALIPLMPGVLVGLEETETSGDSLTQRARPRWINYGLAIGTALLALVLRELLEPLIQSRHPYILPLLGVILTAWASGYGPAMLSLGIGFTFTLYSFGWPRPHLLVTTLPDLVGIALFFFSGVACAMLGASERLSRFQAAWALADALRQRDELEAEITLRRRAETSLHAREADLVQRTEELAAAERRAADALKLYRTLTEAVPQIVWTADPAGTPTYYNRRWREYTGLDSAEATIPAGTSSVHPEDAPRLETTWRAAVHDQPDSFACEFRLRGAEGEFRWFLANAVPLRASAGAILQWVGTLTDINDQKEQAETLDRLVQTRTIALRQEIEERRRAEEKARTVTAELQRSNSELEAFAYVASHDLQEPLRKIQAFGDRLARKQREQLGEQGQEFLDRMMNAATRMRRLIDDLLTFSRVTSRAQPFVPVDLNELLREVLIDLDVRVAQTGARIEALSLPTIDADPSQMRQLFQNLIANSLKFALPDTPPRVRIETEEAAAGRIRLVFADEGIGFDPRYQERIFQVFQRLHGRNEYEGTGVGLAICKKIVERHGGTIAARSLLGRGATFVVELPREQPRTEEPST